MCASHSRDGQLWLGLVAFVIGAVFLLQRFDLVPAETWDYLWPSILVVTGLKWMMLRGKGSCCEGGACESDDSCGSCGGDSCKGSCEMPMATPKKSMKKKKAGKK